MLQLEVFVGEALGPVNACRASAVAIQEVPSLDHEVYQKDTAALALV